MADDRVVIEIELDDGRIVKGFANIAGNAKETGEKVGEHIGNGFLKSIPFVDKLGIRMAFLNQAIELGEKLVKSFEFALEKATAGEKLLALRQQFDVFSERAGVSAEHLKEAFEAASKGTVDTGTLLAAANKGLVELGESADKLPKLFEVARKASLVFGGDVVENFEQIQQAISGGNTRALRTVGIFIDAEKAVKDFAKANGQAAEAITLAGKQQAILNAVLEKGETAFEGINASVKKNTIELKRIKTEFNELGELVELWFERKFGSIFNSFLTTVTHALHDIRTQLTATFGSGIDQTKAQIVTLESTLAGLNEEKQKFIKAAGGASNAAIIYGGELTRIDSRIKSVSSELENAKIKLEDFEKSGRNSANGVRESFNKPLFNEEQTAANLARFQQILDSAVAGRIDAELANASSLEQRESLIQAKRISMEMAFQTQIEQIRRDFLNKGLIEQSQFDILSEELHRQHQAKMVALDQDAKAKMSSIQGAIQNGLAQSISVSMQTIGAAFVKGTSAFEGLKNTILNIVGDMLISVGVASLGIGKAVEAIKVALASLTGGFAIAGGLALIALGGALKASTGGGLVSAATGGGGGGGGIAADTTTGIAPSEEPSETFRPATQVTVNVQGNLLNRKEEALQIVDVLNEFFDSDGGSLTARTV